MSDSGAESTSSSEKQSHVYSNRERVLHTWKKSWHDLSQLSHNQDFVGKPQIFCKHRRGCLANAFFGALKNASFGLGIKIVVAVLRSLVSRRLPKFWVTLWDSLRFASFLGTFAFSYKGINCFLRKILHEDNKLNSFIAGCFSGCSILWLDPADRATYSVYLMVRALKIVGDSASQQEWFPSSLKNIQHLDAGVLVLTACQILYCYIMDRSLLPKSYANFLLAAGRKDVRVINALACIGRGETISNLSGLREYCREKGIDWSSVRLVAPVGSSSQSFPLCDIMHPGMGCVQHWLDFAARHMFEYSLRFYIPLNIVSTLIWSRSKFFKDPWGSLKRIVASCMKSALFLSMYCANAWLSQCLARKLGIYSGKVTWLLGGLFAGASIFLEQKSRRMELALYCMTPTIPSLVNATVDWGYFSRPTHLDSMMFAAAMGVIMMAHQNVASMQPTLQSFMKALMGIN